MMYFHLIALAVISKSKRIAYHRSFQEMSDLREAHSQLINEQKSSGYSIHILQTESESWESVVALDPYFTDIIVFDSCPDFVNEINNESELSAVDIAGYIQNKFSIKNKVSIQKLTYLIFTKFLKDTQQKLFPEPIEAWQMGPVVSEVYRKNKYGILPKDSLINKLMVNEDSEKVMHTINSIMHEYQEMSSVDLIKLTHREGTPWKTLYDGTPHKEIPADLILEYHSTHSDELI